MQSKHLNSELKNISPDTKIISVWHYKKRDKTEDDSLAKTKSHLTQIYCISIDIYTHTYSYVQYQLNNVDSVHSFIRSVTL